MNFDYFIEQNKNVKQNKVFCQFKYDLLFHKIYWNLRYYSVYGSNISTIIMK